MEEEHELEESPLSTTIEREGVSLDIAIYRGRGDEGWHLEVVDDKGTSHVWDDRFATDQAALDEATRTIDEEGLSAFR